jgi:cardiolipin synthase
MPLNLPTLLTLTRIAVIPVLVGLFFVAGDSARWVACVLYTAAALTDYVDGYLARSWRQQSEFGRCLDPIADKLLVAAVLLLLAAFGDLGSLGLLPAVVILCREILVSGLREYLAGLRVGVPVSRLAKWKTSIQMVSIGFLIVGDAGPAILPIWAIGMYGLWLAAVLTLITGYDYLRASLKHMDRPVSESKQRLPAGKTATPVP